MMTRFTRYLSLTMIALIGLTNSDAQEKEGRNTAVFNRDWMFRLGDDSSPTAKGWAPACLPHSFSIPYFMSNAFYTGEGWYRKKLNMPQAWEGKKVFLDFEGAFQETDVYVNGKKAGGHQGGYTGFRIDLTPLLKVGRNEISIRVSNRWKPRLAPRAGEHCFSGGIYRDVYLVVTNPVYIPLNGVWVRTPHCSKQSSGIKVSTEVKNDEDKTANLVVSQRVLDTTGKVVASFDKAVAVPADRMVIVEQETKLATPKLWSPESPTLYTVLTSIQKKDGKVQDSLETQFGFRTIKWTADKGFFLNDKHVLLTGANVHQDHAGWGDAVTNGGHTRDVRLMKEAGFNFIRGSHYPHDPAFTKACDQLGVMFWSEGIFWGMGGQKEHDRFWNCDAYPRNAADRPGFEQSCAQQLREMIRDHRNHPSIVAWSISNEPFFTQDQEEARQLCQKLIDIAHEVDPDRPASVGGAQRGGFDKIGDIASYNGDGAGVMTPSKPSMVSEYGSVATKRPGKYEPGWGDTKGEKYDWRAGAAVWCGFDHGSIWETGARMGIVDYFRIPKRAWYWYRNELAKISPPKWAENGSPTALKLVADKTVINSTDGQDDVHLTVGLVDKEGTPLANEAPITLTIEQGPGEFPTGKSITFTPNSDIDMRDGLAAIEMRSYYSGKSVIKATSPGLKDATITIETRGKAPYVKGKSIETIERPYKRFTTEDRDKLLAEQGETPVSQESPNLANNRPCSSSSASNQASSASDGDMTTEWIAESSDKNPAWILDMEFSFPVQDVKLDFPQATDRKVIVDVSTDKRKWTPLSSPVSAKNASVEIKGDQPVTGRYVRVRFNRAQVAGLKEVTVHGAQ
ncbi:MAG: glycoside hydrolase family 2 TIM barrel-domain containing protein [Akkermansia sp.]